MLVVKFAKEEIKKKTIKTSRKWMSITLVWQSKSNCQSSILMSCMGIYLHIVVYLYLCITDVLYVGYQSECDSSSTKGKSIGSNQMLNMELKLQQMQKMNGYRSFECFLLPWIKSSTRCLRVSIKEWALNEGPVIKATLFRTTAPNAITTLFESAF